ncbi:MAG: hypothetical protein J6N51_13195 [Selenomonas sp.]|nr:hypothetical protein [Selenomonas sp.]
MKTVMNCWRKEQTASEYLQHFYEVPEERPELPLADEAFVSQWQEAEGQGVLAFLAEDMGLPVFAFAWEAEEELRISFARTAGGRLPVIATGTHEDFRAMEAVLGSCEEKRELPPTVNAFTLEAKAEGIFRHRLLLLNRAPYSNLPAEALGLTGADWLECSSRLRLAHECAHYETLRLLGGMKNHALDEILADALGQVAAFGDFSADRQRIFFGLVQGKDTCTGRLSFYTRNVCREDRGVVYWAVDRVLDIIEAELQEMLSRKAEDWEILTALAGRSIADRLAGER